jgi:hypothetical protein
MKIVNCLLLLFLLSGCNNQLTEEKQKKIKETTTKISCFGPEGWVDHWTTEGGAFWRGGWSFHNLKGEFIQSSMCQRVSKKQGYNIK